MDVYQSIILGIVQGITEFLPISSTGHLILAGKILDLATTDFLKTFDIAIQLGSILAVVALYWRQIANWLMLKKLFVAFLPTGVLGLIFYKIVKTYLLGNDIIVLWALFLGGLALIGFEWWYKNPSYSIFRQVQEIYSKNEKQLPPLQRGIEGDLKKEGIFFKQISYRHCLYLGLFQSIAMIPGVSRSAATILGGLWLGLKRQTIVEFSFLLAVPTMAAATGLDLLKSASQFAQADFINLTIGFAVSFVVAMLAIKLLLAFIKKRTFISFGLYRIAVAIIFWLWII